MELSNSLPIEKISIPKERSAELFAKYKDAGIKLEMQYHQEIDAVRDACFQYLGVTSTQELQKKLNAPVNGKFASLPLGFTFPIHLAGRKGKIQSDPYGKNATIFIEKTSTEQRMHTEFEEEYGVIDLEPTEQLIHDITQNSNVNAIVWRSDGIRSNNLVINYSHNGASNKSGISGIGYALYRLHEEIFGKMEEEIAPKLSLLKLYLKLGFVPNKIINPTNGNLLSIDLEDTLKDCLNKGEEKLQFLIVLKRVGS